MCQGQDSEGGDCERDSGRAIAAIFEALTHGLYVVVVWHEVAV